ncbi:LexA repressor [Sporomusa silvacetica DSM 10669]|uniref:LexA repressor n=1 Tax=Sporomusa silvacetica DSM 10669 TaxID=1123289 RepID=A0ABZ3IP45_9FIRM|nr:LexA repressor [Sporomusa silvacetica DSM 10669]
MINAGILDGDYLLVRQQSNASNGDIVVALIDNEEATVKRFFKEAGRIRLQPENDSMEPIYADGAGKKGVIKRTSKGDFSVQITSNEIL